jgi:hypothetical protein
MGHAQSIDRKIADYVSFLSDKKKKAVLTVVKTFAEDETDLWDEMPNEIKAEVNAALKELDAGKGIAHDKVMKGYAKWLKK